MSSQDKVEKYFNRLKFRSMIMLILFIVCVIIFLGVWATTGFALPAFFTDPNLVHKAYLFAFWTVGAILFGVAIAAFIISRGLGQAIRTT